MVSDFGTSSGDVMEFSRGFFADYATVMAASQQVGGDVVITIDTMPAWSSPASPSPASRPTTSGSSEASGPRVCLAGRPGVSVGACRHYGQMYRWSCNAGRKA